MNIKTIERTSFSIEKRIGKILGGFSADRRRWKWLLVRRYWWNSDDCKATSSYQQCDGGGDITLLGSSRGFGPWNVQWILPLGNFLSTEKNISNVGFVSSECTAAFAFSHKSQALFGMCGGWLVCFLLTVCDVLPSKSDQYGFSARTDINLDAVTNAPWFHVPYPGQYVNILIGWSC